jgi:hypothetical protein
MEIEGLEIISELKQCSFLIVFLSVELDLLVTTRPYQKAKKKKKKKTTRRRLKK